MLYPSGNDPAAYALILGLFALESVAILDRYWPAAFLLQALILCFVAILPRRAWGARVRIPSPASFAALAAYLVALDVSLRRYFLMGERLAKKERELVRNGELIDQVYLLNAQFQEYALNAERKSAEDERKRITRDIHDIMGYTLVNLRVMLEVALDLAGKENGRLSDLLSDAIRHTRDGLQSARRDLRNLRVIEEAGESWMARVFRVAETFSKATGVSVRLCWGNVTRSNCPRIKGAVYQFIQEGLTNSFKHGKATEVTIDFRVVGEAPSDSFVARIVDNGQGSAEIVPGIGFAGIRERIELLEGDAGYRNIDGGFEVWVSIPMLSMRKDA